MGNTGGRPVAVGAALRWVGSPGTVAAVLVLAVNDHAGKQAWPGLVTGKLSDLMWMVVSPPVLALLLTPVLRLRGDWPAVVGMGGTAVAFTLAKATPAGAEVASQIWSSSGVPSRIKGDPSDLLVLPALAVAWWLWRASRRPWRGWQALALVAVPAAVAAMVATSAAVHYQWLSSEQGRPVLSSGSQVWTSQDGGLTWIELNRRAGEGGHFDGGPPADEGRCAPSGVCYRLLGQRAPVEVSEDGRYSWQPAFTPPWLTRNGTSATPAAPGTSATSGPPEPSGPAGYGYPGELVVLALPGGGHGVVAHYPGHDLVVRTAYGQWVTVPYPVDPPPHPKPDAGRRSPSKAWPVALAAGWAAAFAGLATRLLRVTPAARRGRLLVGLTIRQIVALYWVFLSSWLCGGEILWFVSGWGVAAALSLWLLPMMTLIWRTGRRPGLLLPGTALAVGGAAMLPYLRWADTAATSWWTASRYALYLAVAGTVLGSLVGALPVRPRRPRG